MACPPSRTVMEGVTLWNPSGIALAMLASVAPSELQLVDQFANGGDGVLEGRLLLGRQLDFDDLLHAASVQRHRHPDVEALHPVLAGEVSRTGQDLLLVLEDGLHHL